MVITGLLALIYPALASVAIVRLLGWVLIVSGIFQGIGLIGASEVPYFWMELLSAVLAIVIGVLLLRHTDAGLLFFSMLFLIYFMIEGLVKVIFAFIIRPFPNWGWVLASGLLGIAFCSLSLGQFLDSFGLDARRLARGAARRRRDSTQLPRLACSTRDLTRRQQRLRRRFCLRCLFGPRLPVGLPNPAVLFVRQLISLAYRAHLKLQFPLFSERLIDCSCDCSPQSLFPWRSWKCHRERHYSGLLHYIEAASSLACRGRPLFLRKQP